jgi:hypothetical protein
VVGRHGDRRQHVRYSINRSIDPCFASGVSYYNLNIGRDGLQRQDLRRQRRWSGQDRRDRADRQVDRRPIR